MSRILAGTLIGGGLVAGYIVYRKLRHTGKELEISHNAGIQEMGIQGIKIRLDVLMKNPSGTGFTIKFPFIRLLYNGSVVGSSSVIDRDIKIPPYGEVKIDNIIISLASLNILSAGYKAVQDIKRKNKITLGLKTTTMIVTGSLKIPFETNETVNIGVKKEEKKK
jgi:hypothetical protein